MKTKHLGDGTITSFILIKMFEWLTIKEKDLYCTGVNIKEMALELAKLSGLKISELQTDLYKDQNAPQYSCKTIQGESGLVEKVQLNLLTSL